MSINTKTGRPNGALRVALTDRLDEIHARDYAATDGPWLAEYSGEQGNCVIPHDAQSTREAVAITRLYREVADAEFIAHARTDVPALANALESALDYVGRCEESGITMQPGDVRRLIAAALGGAS